jgi:CheY-like chemotaxis protein
VFMDIDQHSQAGLAAFEGIRATPRRGHGVPIFAVTNNECRWTDRDYREAGFAALFLKPVEPMRLFLAMDRVLRETAQPPLLEDGALKEMVAQVA